MKTPRIDSAARWIVIGLIAVATPPPGLSEPPKMLFQDGIPGRQDSSDRVRVGYAMMRLPDDDRYRPQEGPLTLPDRTGTSYALLPHIPARIAANTAILNSEILANLQVVLAPHDEITSVFVKSENLDKETAAQVGLPRYLNVWMRQASLTSVSEPKLIWRGYNGSQMEYERLSSGRLIVPFGSFQPHASPSPPTGRHKTVIQYSDDNGETWSESESRLTSPCYEGFNGNNEGACEPAIEQLKDGRIWTLMRTQAGFLYESHSSDNGTTWQAAIASRFNTSTGPPNIMRHKNGWLVVSWNNCEMPPRAAGEGVYGGRDALHIAVSDDEGKTWRGFREIYLDHRRNDNPASSGDRGTAYPLGAFTEDGKIVMLAGQGAGGRNPILIDPQWIVETQAHTDFSDGLTQWSVYKQHGPAKRWWRARAVGCELVANPTDSSVRSLHIRKADELPADGATWNFPNGWIGSLTARVMIHDGSRGGTICLNDRMFDPVNDYGDEFAVFRAEFGTDASDAVLTRGQWHDVSLQWNLAAAKCQLLVDGTQVGELPIRNKTLNGISYVRFRSAAKELDTAGFLVDSVKVSIEDPYAPPCSVADQAEHERRYVNQVVPTWVNNL
ncbi:MAG: exo-alpha-sialidase [Planctomycetia bacterium]|nr:exo-alpha-sialidase [Planctomycetia bacterium]